jgi:acyl-coenzyme A thioesterase PaaI-like protein
VVSVERRFTHGGILAALIDLAADWALVRQTGRGVPTYFLLQLLRSGFGPNAKCWHVRYCAAFGG